MTIELLRNQYQQACDTPSDIYLHLPKLVTYALEQNAQRVIELGSRTGVSTIAWLYALARTGGRLLSIDLDPAPDIGTWAHWEHLQGDDCSMQVLGALFDEPADIVFIDTSHLYEHTVKELRIYRNVVKRGGLLILHDTELPRPEGSRPWDRPYPVKRAVTEFVDEYHYPVEWHTDCWGLAVITVE